MATDTWLDGTDNWDTPSDWSAGLPDLSIDVFIHGSGNPEVIASFGTVNKIDIGWNSEGGTLTFIDAGASSVPGGVYVGTGGVLSLARMSSLTVGVELANEGTLYLDRGSGDGGSSLTIGELGNFGTIQIGPSDNTLSAASTIEAAELYNGNGGTEALGTIDLYGSSTAEATLDVASAAGNSNAAGVLCGVVNLSGNALVEFASGQITTIGPYDSALILNGAHAFVADASNTSSNSALEGLRTIEGSFGGGGSLVLESGATDTTSGALTNAGRITLDAASRSGGSSLMIGGKLRNSGTVQIGPSDNTLSATSTVEASNVTNFTEDKIRDLLLRDYRPLRLAD